MKCCSSYVGVSCVDGRCPMANSEEYEERAYEVVHNCEECHLYVGCDDCMFSGPNGCSEAHKTGGNQNENS